MTKGFKIYLDTSVPSAYFDDRNKQRQLATQEFWQKLKLKQTFVSDLVIDEINATADKLKRQKLLDLIDGFSLFSSQTKEIEVLAQEYVTKGVVPVKHIEDALHLAVATINGIEVLISWNFEHMVKLKTKREVNVINVLNGYRELEIIDPEVF